MAPRGQKAQPDAAQTATEPTETSTPAADLSARAADASAAQDPDQPVLSAPVGVAGQLTGTGDTAPSVPSETVAPATPVADPAAEASTTAASQVLGAILVQAGETPAAHSDPKAQAPERRWFPVADPVSLDGKDYAIGDLIGLTIEQHEGLLKAQVVSQPWSDGDDVF